MWILIFTDFGERSLWAALAGVRFYLFFMLLGRQKVRQKFCKPPQKCFLFWGTRFLRQHVKGEESVKTRHLLLCVNRRNAEIVLSRMRTAWREESLGYQQLHQEYFVQEGDFGIAGAVPVLCKLHFVTSGQPLTLTGKMGGLG